MNQSTKKTRRAERIRRACEKGFTLMEILVALAIVGIIVALTAAALGGRATTTRLESVASQVAATIQGRQQLFINDLRTAGITDDELATELATTFAGSTIITAATTTGTPCVGTTTPEGVVFTVATLDLAEAQALQELIATQVDNLFTDRATGTDGSYNDVFATTNAADAWANPPTTTMLTDDPTAVTAATTVNLCIDSD